MKSQERNSYREFFEKGQQHTNAAQESLRKGDYDAAVSNYCVAIINFLDSLSVNKFGQLLKSPSHESAPNLLQKKLSGIGVSGFRDLEKECREVLQLKNIAAYQAVRLKKSHGELAARHCSKLIDFVEKNYSTDVI